MHLLMSLPIMHLLTLLLLDLCVLTQGQTGNILEYLVFEEEPANRFVGNVKVDAKLETRYAAAILNQLEFNFRYQTPMYALFTIDVNLGVIRTRQPIDRDEICTHQTSCDIDLDVKVCAGLNKVIIYQAVLFQYNHDYFKKNIFIHLNIY